MFQFSHWFFGHILYLMRRFFFFFLNMENKEGKDSNEPVSKNQGLK